MSQMKEQGKNLQDQINEEEIGNLLEKEFRVMIVKMIQNLRNRMEAYVSCFNYSRTRLHLKIIYSFSHERQLFETTHFHITAPQCV